MTKNNMEPCTNVKSNKISLFTAILLNINIMVGIGIFIAPSIMAQKTGNLSFLGWPLITLIFLPVVYSIAKITTFFPEEGSFFTYSNQELGKTSGFISGWLYFLGFAAVSSIQFIGLREILINQFYLSSIKNNIFVFNIFAISLFCFLNILSLSFITKIQNTITILKLIPIFFVIIAMFFYWNPHLNINWPNITNLKYTIPLGLFGFWGFETSCNISKLIAGDNKNVFRAIMIAFLITASIYTLFHFGLLHIMNADNLIKYNAPAFVSFLAIKSPFFQSLLKSLMSSAILITFISSIFGVILSNSSNLHSMAENNLFPFSHKIKKFNKHQRPIFCVWLTGLTILVFLTLINNKIILSSTCNFGIIIAFILTIASLLSIQIKRKLFLNTIPTFLAFFSTILIIYYSWIIIGEKTTTRIIYSLPLFILALFGIILFKINSKKRNKI